MAAVQPQQSALLKLPLEVTLRISDCLRMQEFINLRQTCKSLENQLGAIQQEHVDLVKNVVMAKLAKEEMAEEVRGGECLHKVLC